MEVLRKRPGVIKRSGGSSPNASGAVERSLPPRVPDALPELEEALMLLGNYLQAMQSGAKMKESSRLRLQALIGAVPDVVAGRSWKSGLKELRGELAELEGRSRAVS